MNVDKPETVNEGNDFRKPENEPAPVQRLDPAARDQTLNVLGSVPEIEPSLPRRTAQSEGCDQRDQNPTNGEGSGKNPFTSCLLVKVLLVEWQSTAPDGHHNADKECDARHVRSREST